jgi:hypothetical protein
VASKASAPRFLDKINIEKQLKDIYQILMPKIKIILKSLLYPENKIVLQLTTSTLVGMQIFWLPPPYHRKTILVVPMLWTLSRAI